MDLTVPRSGPVDCLCYAPPSKSVTHRALIAASLAGGSSLIREPLHSGDISVTVRALRAFGTEIRETGTDLAVRGCGARFPCPEHTVIDMENSGTSMRLLAPLTLLCGTPVVLTGSRRMQQRPIGPLADAICAWGGRVTYTGETGFPPVRIDGTLRGGPVGVDASMSSQFISALLMAAPCAEQDCTVTLTSTPVSRSYLGLTCQVMEAFGIVVTSDEGRVFHIPAGQRYQPREFRVEGDYSSASYFFALAAILGGRVRVRNLDPGSVQGDRAFPQALAEMGCHLSVQADGVEISREGPLRGITVDMSSSPDTVQTLCVVAACAGTPTVITGVGHLRYKESDRLNETAAQLARLGGRAEVGTDRITIYPATLHGGIIDPGNDHRTAMSFALLGSAVGGVTIRDAGCVEKSFPAFWGILREMLGW